MQVMLNLMMTLTDVKQVAHRTKARTWLPENRNEKLFHQRGKKENIFLYKKKRK